MSTSPISDSASETAATPYKQLPTTELTSFDFIYPEPTAAKDTTELVVLSTSPTVAGRVAKALESHAGTIYWHNGESHHRWAKSQSSTSPSEGPKSPAVYLLDFENSSDQWDKLLKNAAVVPIAKYLVHPDEPRLEDLAFSEGGPYCTVTTKLGTHTVPVLYKKLRQSIGWSKVLTSRTKYGKIGETEPKDKEQETSLLALYDEQPTAVWPAIVLTTLVIGSAVAWSVHTRGWSDSFAVDKPEPHLSKITQIAVVADKGLSKFEPVARVLTQVRLALFAWLLKLKNWASRAGSSADAHISAAESAASSRLDWLLRPAAKADKSVVSKVDELLSTSSRAEKSVVSKVNKFVSSAKVSAASASSLTSKASVTARASASAAASLARRSASSAASAASAANLAARNAAKTSASTASSSLRSAISDALNV